MSETAIRTENISKVYPLYNHKIDRLKEALDPRHKKYHHDFYALKNVSFEVKKGETVGIIGRNGSGKSTLLKILSGVLTPSSGTYRVNDRIASLLELGTGFNPDLTGIENVYFNGTLFGLSKKEIDVKLDRILDFAGIAEFIRQPVKTYSNGMVVRLAFAIMAHVDADILVIDEALAVGDAVFVQKCMRFLRQFMERGTLLFVSHDIAAVRALCTRAVWLDHGVVREIGEAKPVLDAYLTAVYADQQDIDGAAKTPAVKNSAIKEVLKPRRDCRLDFVNRTNLRNNIEVFEFNENAARWGDGLAKITSTYLQDIHGTHLSWVIGGEEVILTIEARALQALGGVIVGFMVKDRLGQNLFGDNTFITTIDSPVFIKAGASFRAKFRFLMPILPQGTYAIMAGVATGTQRDHRMHDWVHESLFFESHKESAVNGIVGVPIHDIQIEELVN